MAYVQHTSWRDRPGAIAGVIAIHGLVGYVLVTGFSFAGVTETIERLGAREYTEVSLPPPPPPSPPEKSVEPEADAIAPKVVAPVPPLDLGPQRPPVDATPDIIPTFDIIPKVVPSPTPGPSARPSPAFEPAPARPRNDPGGWITDADYRSSWINREMVGTARFRLQIAANGRVEGCTITGSSGHAELDRATCELVTRRARFEPAKDGSGAAVGGSYTSAVRWQLPE